MLIVFWHQRHRNDWMGSRGSNCKPNLLFESFATLREQVCKKWPELQKNKSWILHQVNAPAHNTLFVKYYLAARGFKALQHPPYLPDFSTLWLFPFSKYQVYLKRNLVWVDGREKVKIGGAPKCSYKRRIPACFDQWKKEMEWCVVREVHWRGSFDCRIVNWRFWAEWFSSTP